MARHRRGRGRRGGGRQNPSVDQARDSGGNGRDEAKPSGVEAGNGNEQHRDDDDSRIDQSLPADILQAGPSLGKEAAAPAPLWEEFEALGIQVRRVEPVFPPRPGYGAEGTPCLVRANRFLGRLVDEGLHQYDVTISPEPTPKAGYREVMTKLVSENQHTELGGRFPAYDDRASLFTAGTLPFDTKEFEVTLSAGGDEKMDKKYKVVINHAATISLLQLRMLLAGYPTDIPAQALLVLNTVLRGVLSNQSDDMKCAAIATKDRTLGVDAWKGLYQSIMSTENCLSSDCSNFSIADVSTSVFIQPLLLIEVVQKILKIDVLDRNLTKPKHDKLLEVLRGVRIEVTLLGENRRHKYRIAGLSVNPTSDLSFVLSGATRTVINYFREKYSLDLKYKSLPCIITRSEPNPIYLPIEVCKIVPRQCYQKKLEGSQVSTLRKSACIHPEPERSCHQIVDQEQFNHTKCANGFDIEVDGNLATVDARVLLPPNLKYHDSGSEKTWLPVDGYWNMKYKKVINGAKIRNWACLNFCEDLSKKYIKEFCFELAEMSRIIGVEFSNLKLPIFTAHPDQVEDGIRKCYQQAKNKLNGQKIDLLLAILPGNTKRICETDIGLMSQCCRRSKVSTENSQILANIAIKINAKAGGRNSAFNDVQKSLPVVSNKPTIIFGAHVSHPSKRKDGSASPSIASVLASQNWHEVSKYNSVVHAQGHSEEISGLEDIVRELLHAFANESNKKLQQLIFYRNGISESQFKQVLEKEIPAIEKAWNTIYDNEKPQITFIVMQKRHRLRLSPMDNKYHKLFSVTKKIVKPGTVVDSEICHPAEFDFFLCTEADVKGPRRPVKHLVPRQCHQKELEGRQVSTLRKSACIHPEPEQSCHQVVHPCNTSARPNNIWGGTTHTRKYMSTMWLKMAFVLILLCAYFPFGTARATTTMNTELCDYGALARHFIHSCSGVSNPTATQCCDRLVQAVDEDGGARCLCGAVTALAKIGEELTYNQMGHLYLQCGGLNPEAIRRHKCASEWGNATRTVTMAEFQSPSALNSLWKALLEVFITVVTPALIFIVYQLGIVCCKCIIQVYNKFTKLIRWVYMWLSDCMSPTDGSGTVELEQIVTERPPQVDKVSHIHGENKAVKACFLKAQEYGSVSADVEELLEDEYGTPCSVLDQATEFDRLLPTVQNQKQE